MFVREMYVGICCLLSPNQGGRGLKGLQRSFHHQVKRALIGHLSHKKNIITLKNARFVIPTQVGKSLCSCGHLGFDFFHVCMLFRVRFARRRLKFMILLLKPFTYLIPSLSYQGPTSKPYRNERKPTTSKQKRHKTRLKRTGTNIRS